MRTELLEYLFFFIVIAMVGFNVLASRRARQADQIARENIELRRQTLVALTRIAEALERRGGT